MAETTLNDLDPRLNKQIESAEKALVSGNPSYATQICLGILQRNPGCTDVRRMMRKAQRKLAATQGKNSAFFVNLAHLPAVMKAAKLAKKDPAAGLDAAEKVLNENPDNVKALEIVAHAAQTLGFPNAAVNAYETIRSLKPDDMNIVLALGYALVAAGRGQDAVKCGDIILQKNPGNGEGQDLVRKASVAVTMDKGKWNEEGDYRSKLANANQAVALEQESRVVNDADTLIKLIDELKVKVAKEPDNINHWREMAHHYRSLERYDEALEAIGKARELPMGRGDTTLEKFAADIMLSKMQKALNAIEADLAAHPEDAALKEKFDNACKALRIFRMEQAKALVDKYPNDLNYRYELGVLLSEDGQYDAAIREFQMSRNNPKVRLGALLNLGRTYVAKRFYDLAVEQLQTAKSETPIMTDQKKEIIYELASCFEKMNKADEAIAEYKIIYANDIGYRDVSQKIDEFYAKRQAQAQSQA